jgi:hypothetical protein
MNLKRSSITDQGIKIPDIIWLNPSRAHEIHGTKPDCAGSGHLCGSPFTE